MAKKISENIKIVVKNIFGSPINVDGWEMLPDQTREFKEMTQELENLKAQKYISVDQNGG